MFWVFVFPIVLAAVLGLAFRSKPPEPLPVAVVAGPHAEARLAALSAGPDLKPTIVQESDASLALARAVSCSWSPAATRRRIPTIRRSPSRTARMAVDAALQRAAGRADAFTPARSEVTAGARYVDFLVPGLLGMNLMGTGMWGIAFSLVVARNGNLLKRLIAAPARRSHLLGAQLTSRLIFLIRSRRAPAVRAIRARRADARIGAAARGVALLGALAFSGLGLFAASRPRTIEGVSGVMNLVMVLMWVFSGIFLRPSAFRRPFSRSFRRCRSRRSTTACAA